MEAKCFICQEDLTVDRDKPVEKVYIIDGNFYCEECYGNAII